MDGNRSWRTADGRGWRMFDRWIGHVATYLVAPVLSQPQRLAEFLDRMGFRVQWQPATVQEVGYCVRCRGVLDTPDGGWGGSDFHHVEERSHADGR